jgi:parvulin-like peptidyl-prolyl isomerase
LARKLSLCMVTLAILLAACSVSDVPPQNMPAKASPVPPTNTPSAKAVAPSPAQPTAVPTEAPLAAKVNGQPIVLADFEQEVARRQAALTKQGMDFNSPDGQAAVSMIRQQALEGLIEQALIDQQAAKLGITVADAEVDAAINQSIAEYGGMDAFTKYLKDVAKVC